MGNNSSKPPPLTKQEEEIGMIKFQRDRVIKYQKSLSIQISTQDERIREKLSAGERSDAKAALRRKKYIEDLLEKAKGQREQIQAVLDAIEEARIRIDVVNAIAMGTKTLKEMNEGIGGVERATKIMDEAGEAMADTEEISNVIAGGESIVSEDAIDEEFEKMEREAEAKKAETKRLDAISKGEPLPEVPKTSLRPEEMPLPSSSALNSSVPGSPMPDAPKEEPRAKEGAKKQEEWQMLAA